VKKLKVPLGRVNHCSLHCRLVKFRALMYMGKYGAVIGRKFIHGLEVDTEYIQ
jgi:hypothetical protein